MTDNKDQHEQSSESTPQGFSAETVEGQDQAQNPFAVLEKLNA